MLLHLHPSRIEFGIVFSCHFCASLALFHSEFNTPLALLSVLPIFASMYAYCFPNSSLGISSASSKGRADEERKRLFRPGLGILLGQQHAVLHYTTHEATVRLPRISYYSEFLIVLSFEPEMQSATTALRRYWPAMSGNIVIWADSLSRADDRRLRRYLRFDCPRLPG